MPKTAVKDKVQTRLKPKYQICFPDHRKLTSEYRRWNDVIVEAGLGDPNNTIVKFNWGMWVTDGKDYFVAFHTELQPYTGKLRVGQRVEPEETEHEEGEIYD